MANYFKEGEYAFEERPRFGFHVLRFAQHVHNFRGQFLERRIDTGG